MIVISQGQLDNIVHGDVVGASPNQAPSTAGNHITVANSSHSCIAVKVLGLLQCAYVDNCGGVHHLPRCSVD